LAEQQASFVRKPGEKAKMARLRRCFGGVMDFVDMKYGKLTLANNLPS